MDLRTYGTMERQTDNQKTLQVTAKWASSTKATCEHQRQQWFDVVCSLWCGCSLFFMVWSRLLNGFALVPNLTTQDSEVEKYIPSVGRSSAAAVQQRCVPWQQRSPCDGKEKQRFPCLMSSNRHPTAHSQHHYPSLLFQSQAVHDECRTMYYQLRLRRTDQCSLCI